MKKFIKVVDVCDNVYWLNPDCIASVCKYVDPRSNKNCYHITLVTGTSYNTSFNILLELGVCDESVVSRTLP